MVIVAGRSTRSLGITGRRDMRTIIKSHTSPDQTERVEIFIRENGSYGFEVFDWLEDDLGRTWNPRGHNSYFPNLETAQREAREQAAWLRDANGDA
jgi:hypothetical protein